MKKALGVVSLVTLGALAVVGIHDFWPPATAELKFRREGDGGLAISKYKDGGSFGIHVELKDGKEEVAFLDRRMDFRSPERAPKKDGLLYLGFDAMSAGKPLDLSSPPGRDFERLLRFERRRWLVKLGHFGQPYIETLDEFAAAIERTKRANQSLEPTPAAGTSAAEQPLVPAAVVAHL